MERTTYTDELNEILTLFSEQWGKTTPVAYENVNYKPTAGKEWVRVSIRNGESSNASLGGCQRLRRHIGTVYIQIFTPTSTGQVRQRELSDKALGIFACADIPFYIFRPGYIQTQPADSDGWATATVVIPFSRDSLI